MDLFNEQTPGTPIELIGSYSTTLTQLDQEKI
jgi:hypothetical protein